MQRKIRGTAGGGFIQLIIIIVMAVIILSLLGVSISSLINNKTLKENFALMWKGIMWLWTHYLYDQAITMWQFVRSKF
ncbi:MAG: hypothetical protein AAB482_02650 [Patescibacteria group bacterium]